MVTLMSRVEKTEESNTSLPKRNDEVVEGLDDKKKKTRGRFFGCAFLFVSFLLVGLFVAWQVAATGFVKIPVISSVAFSDPKPVHVVQGGISVEQLSESYFKTTIIKRLQAGGGELKDRTVELKLPETSLTTTLRNELSKSSFPFIDAKRAQIAVLDSQELEIYLPVLYKDQSTALSARIALRADQGSFGLDLLKVKIGSFEAPNALIASLIQPFVNRELVSLNQALSSYMQVNSIVTRDGFLDVAGTFTVQVQK